MARKDHFPATERTWLEFRLDEGKSGRSEANRFLMQLYFRPLRVYFLGCAGARRLGEPEEVINGFFADRLARDSFLEAWLNSGKRLRRWLMNALSFYLKELARSKLRDRKAKELFDMDAHDIAVDNAEREYARGLVKTALDDTLEVCREQNLERHWEVFFMHHYDEIPYAQIARRLRLTDERAKAMARTVRLKFKDALAELLVRDGCPRSKVDAEIESLKGSIES